MHLMNLIPVLSLNINFCYKKKRPKNYANMKAYSSAFQLAIESVIGKSQEVGAASFFSTELVSLNAEGVTSQSDFDIVAFVVVKRK